MLISHQDIMKYEHVFVTVYEIVKITQIVPQIRIKVIENVVGRSLACRAQRSGHSYDRNKIWEIT